MFETAIQQCMKFTRPIHSITRMHGSSEIEPGAATLFFVNSDGWAITCKHVADLLLASEHLGQKWDSYQKEFQSLLTKKKMQHIEQQLGKKYGFKVGEAIRVKNCFIDCVEGELKVEIRRHEHLDLALMRFTGGRLMVNEFPKFPKDCSSLTPGKVLCRLGYPFSEFSNFELNPNTNDIEWNNKGQAGSPVFPLDGMVTRLLRGEIQGNALILGFEMSTPGLRGQSGGPAFDKDGVVWGVQSQTAHLYLGFDVEQRVLKSGKWEKIKNSAFLHVGQCIHVDEVKKFLKVNQISFDEV